MEDIFLNNKRKCDWQKSSSNNNKIMKQTNINLHNRHKMKEELDILWKILRYNRLHPFTRRFQ